MKIAITLICCLSLVGRQGFTQNLLLTQYENAPFLYNPADMNRQGETQLRLNFRQQAMFAGVNFQTFALSGEYAFWDKAGLDKRGKTKSKTKKMKKIPELKDHEYAQYVRGGLGFTVLGENQANVFRTNVFLGRYNHILPVGKARLSLGAQVGWIQNAINFQNIITDNQINTGFLDAQATTNENLNSFQTSYATMGVGAYLYGFMPKTDKVQYFLGLSALQLNQPLRGDARLPMLTCLQAGYTIEAGKLQITPQVRWLLEKDKNQGLIGAKASYKPNSKHPQNRTFQASLFYNTRYNLTAGVGINQKNYSIFLTYDRPIAPPAQGEYMAGKGAIEVHLAYRIARKRPITKQPEPPIQDTIAKAKIKILPKVAQDTLNTKAKATPEIVIKTDSPLVNIIKPKLEPTKEGVFQKLTEIDSVDVYTDIDSDILYFGIGQNNLTEISKQILARNFELLKKTPNLQVSLIGHTCNTGKAEENIILSQARAEKVKAILVSQGIAPTRIKTVGMGDKEPVKDHSTEPNRRQNRRVEVLIIE